MIIELLRWWYGPGWLHSIKRINSRTSGVAHAFSTGTLLKTLFAPWKRIQYSGKSFDAKIQALADNMVSRTVGFVVRFGVLLAALVMIVASLVVSILIVAVWPIVPLMIIFSFYKGIAG